MCDPKITSSRKEGEGVSSHKGSEGKRGEDGATISFPKGVVGDSLSKEKGSNMEQSGCVAKQQESALPRRGKSSPIGRSVRKLLVDCRKKKEGSIENLLQERRLHSRRFNKGQGGNLSFFRKKRGKNRIDISRLEEKGGGPTSNNITLALINLFTFRGEKKKNAWIGWRGASSATPGNTECTNPTTSWEKQKNACPSMVRKRGISDAHIEGRRYPFYTTGFRRGKRESCSAPLVMSQAKKREVIIFLFMVHRKEGEKKIKRTSWFFNESIERW